MKISALAAAILLLFASGPTQDTPTTPHSPTPRGTGPEITRAEGPAAAAILSGHITDVRTGEGIAEARIFVARFNLGTRTDRTGAYRLVLPNTASAGQLTVRVDVPGYLSATQTVSATDGVARLDIGLTPAPELADAPELELIPGERAARSREDRAQAVSAIGAMPAPSLKMVQFGVQRRERSLPGRFNRDFQREGYSHIEDNPFLSVGSSPLSTFGIDVDRASYANVRRFLRAGQRPPIDAVRIEELINYFPYDYGAPRGHHPFAVHTEVVAAPWNPSHRLVRIGLKGENMDAEELPPSNLVFLLDVSGSMQSPDKLPLLKTALGMLVNELRPTDRVAIVVYAGAAGLVLESTPGSQKRRILGALEELEAGGSTAGSAGIRLAYEVAQRNWIDGGNNRVILATDGDFNIGPSSDAELRRLIERKREEGTFLTVLGFGTGNYQDAKMEQLADHGNGNFAYIDDVVEARKVLVTEMGGTLHTIAQDVKIQVEFNPARVQAYRLIGYENRLLAAEDFDNDRKDAGELGAGHTVTALYEVVLVGAELDVDVYNTDSLRYQTPPARRGVADSSELLFVKLRYKRPGEHESVLLSVPVQDEVGEPSVDLRFASAVAAFGMILRDSPYSAATWSDVARWAREGLGEDPHGYRGEFLRLVDVARHLGVEATERY